MKNSKLKNIIKGEIKKMSKDKLEEGIGCCLLKGGCCDKTIIMTGLNEEWTYGACCRGGYSGVKKCCGRKITKKPLEHVDPRDFGGEIAPEDFEI